MKSVERKHLRMRIFHKNKDSRSKDQDKKRILFHGETKFHFGSHVSTL